MTQAEIIAAVLAAPPDRLPAILAAASGGNRKQPIIGTEAASILGVCRKTLRRYERLGVLTAIRVSPRKIRYDRRQVEELATSGRGPVAESGAK